MLGVADFIMKFKTSVTVDFDSVCFGTKDLFLNFFDGNFFVFLSAASFGAYFLRILALITDSIPGFVSKDFFLQYVPSVPRSFEFKQCFLEQLHVNK